MTSETVYTTEITSQVRNNRLDNYYCAGFYFTSNFDSGNLGRVELEKEYSGLDIEVAGAHKEYNLWTSPDCSGSCYETTNRTWFFFSVRGGEENEVILFHVKNLNKQQKLFNGGMAPVMRVGKFGKWERIKDKPTFRTDNEDFVLEFRHYVYERPNTEVYYAFTYPFTYAENLDLLEMYTRKFEKKPLQVKFLITRLELLMNEERQLHTPTPKKSTDIELYRLRNEIFSIQNEIYFHRELLMHSLENRRVDLLTISSYHNIENTREERLQNLFPELDKPRCYSFRNKKVIFLSSRVHPGETCSSFVLNGFLQLLLEKKNPTAMALRRMYVFKIVPILNPDGVYRGFYRTDTLGQNLNRFYLNPKLEYQPAIYAVKKLIKFYQFGNAGLADSDVEDTDAADLRTLDELRGVNQGPKRVGSSTSNSLSSDVDDDSQSSSKNPHLIDVTKTKADDVDQLPANTSLTHLKNTLRERLEAGGKLDRKESQTSELSNKQVLNKISKILKSSPLEKSSNLFLYIDMHGHASKKGVFMYGNYFSNTFDAVECMLLPKLMSINSPHFHYDHCNFSEKNMYKTEKRDGLSKEGSGRVAVYKLTGLIKSYTLECNYNSGNYVNILPPRPNQSLALKTMCPIPPKYSPHTYEDVGKALGPSILDLTNSNNQTRLYHSDYRTVQGVRVSIRNEIDRANALPPKPAPSKVPQSSRSQRKLFTSLSSSSSSTSAPTLPRKETATKENKEIYNQWSITGAPVPSSSGLQQIASTSTDKKVPLKFSRNIKKTSTAAFKVRPNNLYGTKFNPIPSQPIHSSTTTSGTTLSKKKQKVLGETSINSTKKNNLITIPNKKPKISSHYKNPIKLSERKKSNIIVYESPTSSSSNSSSPASNQILPEIVNSTTSAISINNNNEPRASTSSTFYENIPNSNNNNNNKNDIDEDKIKLSDKKHMNEKNLKLSNPPNIVNISIKKQQGLRVSKKKRIARYDASILKRKKKQNLSK